MTDNQKRIVRLAVRFMNKAEEHRQEQLEAYEFDSQFDGGEFSGPAMQRQFIRLCNRDAKPLGFANAEVAFQVADAVLYAGRPFRFMGIYHG